jgi:hypothetical protein
MAKIREDLVGVVTVHQAGVARHLRAGDKVPGGVEVDDALLEQGSRRRARTSEPDPVSAGELDAARGYGFDVDDDTDPEFVRGLLAGYQAGSSAAVSDAVGGAVAGPDDERVSTEGGAVPADSGTVTDPGTGEPVVAEVDYDPGEHTVDEVLAELENRSPGERAAIIAKEGGEGGKQRVGITDSSYATERS